MYLNADIVFEGLNEVFSVKIFGPRDTQFSLHRPELLDPAANHLKSNHLYIVERATMPPHLGVKAGACVVCVGSADDLGHYKAHCCVIQVDGWANRGGSGEDAPAVCAETRNGSAGGSVPDSASGPAGGSVSKSAPGKARAPVTLAEVFNRVQEVYNRFDDWEDDLSIIVNGNADIQTMLDRSQSIFGNPLFVIDADFSLLGIGGAEPDVTKFPINESFDGASLQLEAFRKFSDTSELLMYEDEPFFINILDESTLNKNLLLEDEYLGCLTMYYANRGHRASDKPLLGLLGDYLEQAIGKTRGHLSRGRLGSLRDALKDLVFGKPLDSVGEFALATERGRHYIGALLVPSKRMEQLPLGYICKTFEAGLDRSIAFEYDESSLVAFIDATSALRPGCEEMEIARELLMPYVRSLELKIGLSDPVKDLTHAASYVKQAHIAFDIGSIMDPMETIYVFQRYSLHAMVINATVGLPLEFMMTPGLVRLIDHDAHSDTSYVDTLRILLDENMNITKTAAVLYVHRSTLLERLSRIRRELGEELDTPEGRLRLRFLIQAMDLQAQIRGKFDATPR